MTKMHFLLFFTILTIVVSGSLGVHPGDPFPIDQSKSQIITSEDLVNANEILDPNDDEISPPSEPLIDSTSDEDNSVDNVISTSTSTSTKSTLITKLHNKHAGRKENHAKKVSSPITKSSFIAKSHDNDANNNLDKKPSLSHDSSILLPTKSISKKNLIKIGRWKHENLQKQIVRYWYEPEGGHMGAGWTFDGFIFQAYNKSESDTEPVYAFHSEIRSIWTNTVQMDPKSPIIGNDQWVSDGVSFYAYTTSLNSTELQPVFRYWNKLKPGTTDATETRITYLTMKEGEDKNDEDQSEWTFDNILFYALPIKDLI